MNTSQKRMIAALNEQAIDKFWLGYFQETFRENLFSEFHEAYKKWSEEAGNNQASLAKKMGKRPEQVCRWLSSPNNLEADTISDLAIALGYSPKITFVKIADMLVAHIPNDNHRMNAISYSNAPAPIKISVRSSTTGTNSTSLNMRFGGM